MEQHSDHKGKDSQKRNIFKNSKFYKNKVKMAALTKNAISITVRDRAIQTKIGGHRSYNSQITNIFKNSKFYKKNKNGRLT